MARLSPSEEDRYLVSLLQAEVRDYFQKHWKEAWYIHGTSFSGIENIHNKNSFYEHVKDQIDLKLNEKYGLVSAASKSISKDSIRRFFTDASKGFDDKTLNAFLTFIGSEDNWEAYKLKAGNHTHQKDKRRGVRALWATGVVIMLLAAGISGHYLSRSDSTSSVVFTASLLPGSGFPRKVKITYDLQNAKYKSAVIMTGSYRMDLSLLKGDTVVMAGMPQRYPIKLILDGNLAEERRLLVPSDGWWGSINNKLPLSKETFLKDDGTLHCPSFDRVRQIYGDEYYTSFINFSEFGVNGDQLALEADVINSPENGGLWAYDVSVTVIGTKDDIGFNLLNPDATMYARLIAGQTDFKDDARAQHLSRLGVDLSRWRHLSLTTANHTFSIKLDDETLIQHAYQGEIGEVMGIQFYMKGSGAVKNVQLGTNGAPESMVVL